MAQAALHDMHPVYRQHRLARQHGQAGSFALGLHFVRRGFRKYKPDPAAYLGVAQVFDVTPGEVMLVAAHQDDLAHARAAGLRTASRERPLAYEHAEQKDVSGNPEKTLHAQDLIALAERLGC